MDGILGLRVKIYQSIELNISPSTYCPQLAGVTTPGFYLGIFVLGREEGSSGEDLV